MSLEIPIIVFDASRGGESADEMARLAREDCVSSLVRWRARQGADDDVRVTKTYVFPSGDEIIIDSASPAEVTATRTAANGEGRRYRLDHDSNLVNWADEQADPLRDYRLLHRTLFDAINFAWADGHEL